MPVWRSVSLTARAQKASSSLCVTSCWTPLSRFGQDHRLPVLQPPRGPVLVAADAPVAAPGVLEGLSDGGCFRGGQQLCLIGVV